jgi:hypothetical protein
MKLMKIHTCSGQKGGNEPSEAKNGIWGPKSVWSCDMSIDRKFCTVEGKMYIFRGQKAEYELS